MVRDASAWAEFVLEPGKTTRGGRPSKSGDISIDTHPVGDADLDHPFRARPLEKNRRVYARHSKS